MLNISGVEELLKKAVDHLTELSSQYAELDIQEEDGIALAERHITAIQKAARQSVVMDGLLQELKQKPEHEQVSPICQELLTNMKVWCEEWLLVEVVEADYA